MTSIKTKREKVANRNSFVKANLYRDREAPACDFCCQKLNDLGVSRTPSMAEASSATSKAKVRFMSE